MAELPYPWTKIEGQFQSESSVEIRVAIIHNSDPVAEQAVVDAVKEVVAAAGATAVKATEYSVASTAV